MATTSGGCLARRRPTRLRRARDRTDRAGRRPPADRSRPSPADLAPEATRTARHGRAREGSTPLLVSHLHFDHFDRPSLRLLGTDVTVVVPTGARRLVRGFTDVREVDVGDEVRIGEVTIQRDPGRARRGFRLMLRSAPSLGFLVSGSQRIYFAGDTDLFEGMAALAGSLDVALLPVSGWGSKVGPGHLDPLRAAQSLRLLKPRLAIPIHWGTFSPRAPKHVGGSARSVSPARGGARAGRGGAGSSIRARR